MPTIKVSKKDVKIKLGANSVYPALEDLTIKPSGETQIFNHPNSYGYDIVTVSPVESDVLDIIPSFENQIFKGLFNTVNVNAMNVPSEQWYVEEVETWT